MSDQRLDDFDRRITEHVKQSQEVWREIKQDIKDTFTDFRETLKELYESRNGQNENIHELKFKIAELEKDVDSIGSMARRQEMALAKNTFKTNLMWTGLGIGIVNTIGLAFFFIQQALGG